MSVSIFAQVWIIWQTTKINAWMPNNLISMTIKTKVFFREIKGDFTLWEDSNTTAAAWFSCKPSFVLLQRHRVFVVKYPPPAHSRTHFVLFTSVARVSNWIFRQIVAKSAKTVWLLVWMSGTTEEWRRLHSQWFSPFGCQSCPLLWKLKSKGIDHFGRCDVVKWSQLSKCVHYIIFTFL